MRSPASPNNVDCIEVFRKEENHEYEAVKGSLDYVELVCFSML